MLHHTRRLCAYAALAAVLCPALRGPGPRRFLQGQDHLDPDGDEPGGSYDLLRPHHRRASLPPHSRQSDHHHGAHAGRRRRDRRQPYLRAGVQDGTKILLSTPYRWPRSWRAFAFRSAKFQWLGTYDAIAHTMAIWHEAQVNTIDDLRTKPLTFGSFAKAHLTYQWPSMTKYVLGANFKVITGYRSGSDCNLAMERGEIQGWAASWENLAGTRPQWLTEKKVSVLLSFTLERKGQLPDVPTLLELAPPDKKDIVEFLAAGTPFGRAMAVGPGVPADRVAVLRKAFDGLMKDQAFLADAQKRNIDIDPRNAARPCAGPASSPPPRPT